MVWYCTKHEQHSIDDVCPDCAREPTIKSLTAEIELAQSKLDAIQRFVDAQAEDEGLWAHAEYASEAYIQHGLRGLHAYIESVIEDGPRSDTTKDCDHTGSQTNYRDGTVECDWCGTDKSSDIDDDDWTGSNLLGG